MGSSEKLLRNIEPGDPRRRYAEEIKKEGQLSAGIFRQLLAAATFCFISRIRWKISLKSWAKFFTRTSIFFADAMGHGVSASQMTMCTIDGFISEEHLNDDFTFIAVDFI